MSAPKTLTTYRAVSSGAFLSGLVGLDLFLNFYCAGIPLLFYLVVGGIGAWFGGAQQARLSRATGTAQWLRRTGVFLAAFSVLGICVQLVKPVDWQTKCSWRYCGRAMGLGLLKSPFPVGTPSCTGWWTCANEYSFPPGQYETALRRMEAQGCPAP